MEERPSEMKYVVELQQQNMELRLNKLKDDCVIFSKTAGITASCYLDKVSYTTNEEEQKEFMNKSKKCAELALKYNKIKSLINEALNTL